MGRNSVRGLKALLKIHGRAECARRLHARVRWPHFELLDAHELLDSAIEVLQTKVRNADAVVTVGADVSADLRRPGKTPEIAISAGDGGGWTVFSVKDNGIGVPQHKAELFLAPLKRLHGKQFPGTGIGLAICRKIEDLHGVEFG